MGLLVLLNIMILSFIFLGKSNNGFRRDMHRPPPPGERMNERLGLNDDQKEIFESSRQKHIEFVKNLSQELEEASLAYYLHESKDELKDSLFADVILITDKIYKANDTHFNEVRSIFTDKQQPEMERFMSSILMRRGSRRMPER